MHVGHILDAQDYLGKWHLSIVIDISGEKNKQIHFLPFNKANRDEEFTEEDNSRIAPIFKFTEVITDLESSLAILRDYLSAYRVKNKKEDPRTLSAPA